MIRPYTESDRPAVEKHIVDFQDYERKLNLDWKPGIEIASQYLNYLLKHTQNDGIFIVAEIDGSVIGYAAGWVEVQPAQFCSIIPSSFRLCDMYVSPAARNKGVGTALINEMEKYAKVMNQTHVILNVLADNALARDVYLKLDFADYEVVMMKKL